MAKTLIRCLHERDYLDIRDGKWPDDVCRVYYGFNNYSDTPAHINELVNIIKSEVGVPECDMHVHYVTRNESIRHAHFTMVQITEDVNKVCDNINNYTIL
jgi:hypothetical protein